MTNRITKQIAEAIAKQLTAPKRAEIAELRAAFKTFVTQKYIESLPAGILAATKFKDFFNTTSQTRLVGEGLPLGYKWYALAGTYPKNEAVVHVNPQDAQTVLRYENQLETLNQQANDLEREIGNALLNLRTYKNVEQEFPEAAALLPVKENSAIAINLKDIRCKLDANNC